MKVTTPQCVFFHLPSSPDYIFFGIRTIIRPKVFDRVEIGILKHGEDSWKNVVYRSKYREFKVSIGPPVLNDERLYFLDVRGNVAYFDINEDKWVVHSRCLKQRRLRRDIDESYLIKPKGESTVFAVFVVHDESKVKVFKLMRGMLWELVKDLGNTVRLHIGLTIKNIANKIFFTKYHGDKIVYYSLDTRKYHSFEGNYSSNDAYGLKRFEFATWTMPTQIDPQLSRELTWFQQVEKTTPT